MKLLSSRPLRTLPTLLRYAAYHANRYLLRRPELTAVAKSGLHFRFKTEDSIGRYIYAKGTYERELTRFLFEEGHFPKGGIALDIGANLGYYALHMAQSASRVVAFEPHPTNYGLLCDNIELNGLTNVDARQLALGATPGEADLFSAPEGENGGHSLLSHEGRKQLSVKVETLDRCLAAEEIDPKTVSFVKMDVEGFEYQVLLGATRLLEAGPVIFAEFTPGLMKQEGETAASLLDFMQQHDYLPFKLHAQQLQSISLADLQGVRDDENLMVWWQKTTI